MMLALACCPASEVDVEFCEILPDAGLPLNAKLGEVGLEDDLLRFPNERFPDEFAEAEVKATPPPELSPALAPAPEPAPKPEPEKSKPGLTPAPEKELKKHVQLQLPIALRERESDYEYDDFQISFTKIAGEALGAVAWTSLGSFCVLGVVRGGPIERWNKRNELTVLKSGAIVYEVKAERGDSALTGEAMARLAKAAQHVTIKARYYTKKKVYIENARGCNLGIRLFEGTTIVESIDEPGLVAKQNDLLDERNLILPGDRITHINNEDCAGEDIVQMLRDVAGTITLTIRNAGCVLDL